MRRSHLISLLLVLMLCGSLFSASSSQAAPQAGSWLDANCPFSVPRDLKVRCGWLYVPEDHSKADSPLLRLSVAIVPARTKPQAEPLLYLSGGPGSGALLSTVSFAKGWASFVANRDFVVIDQRGTGFSQPSLACPETQAIDIELLTRPVTREEKVRSEMDAMLRCRERLMAQGIDLTAYTSAQSAADLAMLRQALGYSSWSVFGISYGTRLALTLMRDHPEGLRSVILDSTYPPQVNLHTDMPANTQRVFQKLFESCAASRSCARAYPNLEETFYKLVERLDQKAITLQVTHPTSKQKVPIVVDGSGMIALLYRTLYSTSELPNLPKLISDTSKGNYSELARLEAKRLTGNSNFSHGMYFSVQCNEEIAFATPESVAETTSAYPHLQRYFEGIFENTPLIFEFCQQWGVREVDPRENEPVVSEIPTLILAGAFDPITPPAWGEATGGNISPSYVYTFPNSGHAAISSSACPASIVKSFLADPYSYPQAQCLAQIGAPQFR